MMDIQIVVPAVSDDYVSESLRELTKRLQQVTGEIDSGGLLGGTYGYGVDFENDVFMMHSYCWCDRDECGWCNGEKPNFLHKATGANVFWYKYIGRGMEINSDDHKIAVVGKSDWPAIFAECFASLDAAARGARHE